MNAYYLGVDGLYYFDGEEWENISEPINWPVIEPSNIFPSQATASHLAWKHPLIDG